MNHPEPSAQVQSSSRRSSYGRLVTPREVRFNPEVSEPLKTYYDKSCIINDMITCVRMAEWFLQSTENACRMCDWLDCRTKSCTETSYQIQTVKNTLEIISKLVLYVGEQDKFREMLQSATSLEGKPMIEILLRIINGLNASNEQPFKADLRNLARDVGRDLYEVSAYTKTWGSGYGLAGNTDGALDQKTSKKYDRNAKDICVLLGGLTDETHADVMEVLRRMALDFRGTIVSYHVRASEGRVQISHLGTTFTVVTIAEYFHNHSSFVVIGKMVTEKANFTGRLTERMIPYFDADEPIQDSMLLGEQTLQDCMDDNSVETAQLMDERKARFIQTFYRFTGSLAVNVLKAGFGIDLPKK